MTRPAVTPGRAGLALSAAAAGWVLHDLAVFLTSGEPGLALAILPRSLLAVAAAFALGALIGSLRSPLLRIAAIGLGLLAVHLAAAPLGPCAWALAAGSLLALAAGRGGRPGLLRTGLALGACASVGLAWLAVDLGRVSFLVAGAALAALAAGRLANARSRHLLTGAVLLAAAAALGWEVDRTSLRPVTPPASSPRPAAGPGPNLLLVVLDTVRADHLAPYGYERVTTPRLDAFVEARCERYTHAWSTSSWTLPSHASLFTGLLPSEHGATHPRGGRDGGTVDTAAAPAQRLRSDVPTLAGVLRERGWRTGAVLSNHAYLDPRFGLDRGYEHYDARPAGKVKPYLALVQKTLRLPRPGHQAYRDARQVSDLALRWLARAARDERPFFLTVNYMDAHAPYLPPPPFDRAFGGQRVERPMQLRHEDRPILYDRSLAWLDSELARLLEAVGEDTVVIVTSDHGEALGDHGFWMHDWNVYEELVRVPLYVAPVGGRGQRLRSEPVTGADVFHLALAELGLAETRTRRAEETLAEWFQVLEVPEAEVLADKHVERDLITWLEGPAKVIVSSTGEVEVYDLERDPGESEPLALPDERRAAALQRARAWWAARPPPATEEVDPLEAGDIERLRELGYLGGDS